MNANSLQPKQEMMEKLNAFSLYLRKGIEVVKSMFPEYETFVTEHKGKSMEEVRNELLQTEAQIQKDH